MGASRSRKVRQWRIDLHTIFGEIVGMYHDRRIYAEVSEVHSRNPALHVDRFFCAWLSRNYGAGLAVAIRRQTDRSGDVISMGKLLEDLERNVDLLTREWFVTEHLKRASADDRTYWEHAANREFDEFAPHAAAHASAALIREDQDRLQGVASRVRIFVNKRLAHSTRNYETSVTMKDLHTALDVLGELLKRYHHLLEQAALSSTEATIPTDWKAVLRMPWIPPGKISPSGFE